MKKVIISLAGVGMVVGMFAGPMLASAQVVSNTDQSALILQAMQEIIQLDTVLAQSQATISAAVSDLESRVSSLENGGLKASQTFGSTIYQPAQSNGNETVQSIEASLSNTPVEACHSRYAEGDYSDRVFNDMCLDFNIIPTNGVKLQY